MKKRLFAGLLIGLLTFWTVSDAIAVFYDFESGTPTEITGGSLQGTSGYAAHGFGNYAQWSSGSAIALDLSGIAAHSSFALEFDLAVIDSWDGSSSGGGTVAPDYFNVAVDGISVFRETFDNFLLADQSYTDSAPITFGSNICGIHWDDSAYHITLSDLTHSASTVTITWFADGGGWQGGSDESFAIDNIDLTPIPEPATLLLLGTGLAGLVGSRFGRKKHVQLVE